MEAYKVGFKNVWLVATILLVWGSGCALFGAESVPKHPLTVKERMKALQDAANKTTVTKEKRYRQAELVDVITKRTARLAGVPEEPEDGSSVASLRPVKHASQEPSVIKPKAGKPFKFLTKTELDRMNQKDVAEYDRRLEEADINQPMDDVDTRNTTSKLLIGGRAISRGDEELVLDYLDNDADPNVRDLKHYDQRPLHKAILANQVGIVKILLKHPKTDINSKTFAGETPLYFAAKKGNPEVIDLLLSNGADINALTRDDETMLHSAVDANKLEVVDQLIKAGAEVNAANNQGETPLFYAVQAKKYAMTEKLLNKGANVDATGGTFELTALHLAAQNGDAKMVELLLSRGADAGVVDIKQVTALHRAVESGDMESVKILIDHGADVSAKDEHKESPLDYARNGGSIGGNPLEQEAGSNELDGITLESPVRPKGNGAMVELLEKRLQKKQKTDDLFNAIKSGDINQVSELLDEGVVNANATAGHGHSAIHQAIEGGNSEIVELLIKKGANVNVGAGAIGTPLFAAVSMEKTDMVELLLKQGADVNASDQYGTIPLHQAVASGNTDIASRLIDAKAKADIKNKHNISPLDLVKDENQPNHEAMVKLFEDRGLLPED